MGIFGLTGTANVVVLAIMAGVAVALVVAPLLIADALYRIARALDRNR